MTAVPSIDPARAPSEHLERAEPDLLRALLKTFVEALMGAEADAICGAPYGTASPDRTRVRNGYRPREWDTRTGTIELAIPRLRTGSYFPDWLLERRKRAERALTTVVATCYLLGVSTRRMEKLVETRDQQPVQEPGQRDGQGARRARRVLPHPTAGRRSLHVRHRRCTRDEGP
jgi:putative transposase